MPLGISSNEATPISEGKEETTERTVSSMNGKCL